MTILRGFTIVALSALICALVGLGVGYTLGATAPGYYRTVFRSGNSPEFDPVQVGIGLGLSQGLLCGLVVGCVVVIAVTWYNSRRQIIIREFGPDLESMSSKTETSEAIRALR
jgi:hypothetical protein